MDKLTACASVASFVKIGLIIRDVKIKHKNTHSFQNSALSLLHTQCVIMILSVAIILLLPQ